MITVPDEVDARRVRIGCDVQDIEHVQLSGTLAQRAQHQGWLSSSLSLSHAECHAMAVVLVACGPAESE
jgi:phosphopantetheinyl transferase (holo-ACP synthase)